MHRGHFQMWRGGVERAQELGPRLAGVEGAAEGVLDELLAVVGRRRRCCERCHGFWAFLYLGPLLCLRA